MKIGARVCILLSTVLLVIPSLAFGGVPAESSARAVADNIAYNAGSSVHFRIIFSGTPPPGPLSISATIRYLGDTKPVVSAHVVARGTRLASSATSTDFQPLWAIPQNARTGCYEADLVAHDSKGGATVFDLSPAFTFTVYRKLIRIRSVDLDRTFYTSGDPVGTRVTLENLSGRPISGLLVEFSQRYWPWIAQTSERAGVDVFTLAKGVALAAHGRQSFRSSRAAAAPEVKAPTAYQFAVVVWDRARKNIYAIAFSPLAFVHPPGIRLPEPYAGAPGATLQYLHPNLGSFDFTHYRQFYPPSADRAAIQFDTSHTLFASGAEAEVRFTVRNPDGSDWRHASVRVRWLDPDKQELSSEVLNSSTDLLMGALPVSDQAKLALPAGKSGIYRARVEITDPSGEVLAANALELGVNPSPKSILIFCAHQDDEGAHHGIIRAAVENHIPIHFVYFTGGDAGSCDRYYQHSCGPNECLNFGELRMEEARASLEHLGVPREDIFFLGLPDGGSGKIWFDHRLAADPYMSVMLATDHSPYAQAARPNLPFARDSVVEAAKEFIQRFHPEVIYTGHPDERHVDHRTNNWFVMRALEELSTDGPLSPEPTVLVDQSYGPGPQKRAPYQYQKETFYVSGEAAALGQEAGWFYQSQGGNEGEGNHRDYEQLRREEVHWRILDWKKHPRWNDEP